LIGIDMSKTYQKAIIAKCSGEAHSSDVAGQKDHCWICMPYWETYPVCPKCKSKPKKTNKKGFGYYCKKCKEYLIEGDYKNPISDREIDFTTENT